MAIQKDLKALDEMYRKERKTAGRKQIKEKFHLKADVSEEEQFMGDFSTTFEILSRTNDVENKTGADRDVTEVSEDSYIFERLDKMLKESGRTGESKHMIPVTKALNEYLAQEGIQVNANALKAAKGVEGDEAQKDAIKKAHDEAFDETMSKVDEKMQNFIDAANQYVEDRTGITQAWTAHGKVRRALIRAALVQMTDQKKFVDDNKEAMRNNIHTFMEWTVGNRDDVMKLRAHDVVDMALKESVEKREADIYTKLGKEIAERIKADEELKKHGEDKGNYEEVAQLFNFGKTKDDLKKYDISALYNEYAKLRQSQYDQLTTSREALLALKHYTIKDVKPESQKLKNQKAAINAVFYILTGQLKEPEYAYLWEKPELGFGEGDENVAEFVKVYPTSFPVYDSAGKASGEEFVEFAKTNFGENCLDDINYMKYTKGTAIQENFLKDSGEHFWYNYGKITDLNNQVWKGIGSRLNAQEEAKAKEKDKDKDKPPEQHQQQPPQQPVIPVEKLDAGSVIQLRYLGIMKALNNEEGILPKGLQAHKDIPEAPKKQGPPPVHEEGVGPKPINHVDDEDEEMILMSNDFHLN